jgi:phosphatidylinositol kinase/protein kinase (PI-3  family)
MFSNPLVSGHRLLANEKNIDYLACIKNFQTSLVNAERFVWLLSNVRDPNFSVYTQLAELKNITSLSDNSEAPMSAISCEDVSLVGIRLNIFSSPLICLGSIFQETISNNEKGTNEVASEILQKCRSFLKGIDSEKIGNPMSVDKHVNSLIMSATDKQNLSKMFEGW